jgi:NitT/TauT family transport system substrate-binding protein
MDSKPALAGGYDRRAFLKALSVGGAAGIGGWSSPLTAAEPPPETTRIRMPRVDNVCWAPAFVAEDLLKAEGFAEVRLVRLPNSAQAYTAMAAGELDIMMAFVAPSVKQIDAGNPLLVLAGVHPGCIELIASPRIGSVRDLKGKTVAVSAPNDPGQLFAAAFVGHVGLDPQRDIQWVFYRAEDRADLLLAGKIDAFMATPPLTQQLRARKIGRVIVNMTTDRPWSQYFCCVLTANRDFARKHPIATKRAMRAILKASSLCASDPVPVARHLVDGRFASDYESVLQGLREIPYGQWRTFDIEDTVRFFALRLKEAGFIKSSPQKIIAEGSDWRFLNELKKELKA